MISLPLLLILSASAQAQILAPLSARLAPVAPAIAPLTTLSVTPSLHSALPAPTLGLGASLSAPLVAPAPAAPAVTVPSVGEGRPVDELSMESVLQLQGYLLGILTQRTGQESFLLSMAMSMYGHGLTVKDYRDALRELIEIEASPDEIKEALLSATSRTPFAKPLSPDNRPDQGEYMILEDTLRNVAREVEMLRNNRFMRWTTDCAQGKPTPEAGFAPEVRRLRDGGWWIRLGYLRRDGAVEPLIATARPSGDEAPNLAYFLDPMFASPKLDLALRSALAEAVHELERQGALPAGYAAQKTAR